MKNLEVVVVVLDPKMCSVEGRVLEAVSILLQRKLISPDQLGMGIANVAKMPGLVCNLGDGFPSSRVALDESILY